MDTDFFEDSFFIVHSNREFRRFTGGIQKDMTAMRGVRNFFLGMLSRKGRFWEAVAECMNLYSDKHREQLHQVGVIVTFEFGGDAAAAILDDNHPIRLSQRLLCE